MTKLSCTLAAGVAAVALGVTWGPGSTNLFPDLAPSAALAMDQSHGPRHARPHHHFNAHTMLGENLRREGKHYIGKLGSRTVTAEVKNGKVVNMSAGDLTMTKVKSKSKMASVESGFVPVAYRSGEQLAQYDSSSYYYGYCTDDGYETTCYWYEADDVDTSSGDWVEYTTYDASY